MLTETFRSISTAVRKLLKSWQSMLLLAIVYAALLAALYFFMAIEKRALPRWSLHSGSRLLRLFCSSCCTRWWSAESPVSRLRKIPVSRHC